MAESIDAAAAAVRAARSIVACGFDFSGTVAWRLAGWLRMVGCSARVERDL